MKTILIRAKSLTVTLKMQENAQNSKINLIIKIVAMISFVCFNESRIKRTVIRKTTEVATITIKKLFY